MERRKQLVRIRDITIAVGLLTRLPLRVAPEYISARGASAAWAYPVAGMLVALLSGAVGWLAFALGLAAPVAAGLALLTQIVVTGAMHEDGLADSADGLWGGWDRDERLNIMKDSRIGAYGVIALILSIGLRWTALSELGAVLLPALLASAALSRAAMVLVMWALPNARDGGLSASVGRPAAATTMLALALASALTLALAPVAGVGTCLVALGGVLACAAIAKTKIGGQTGDILGATQQVVETLCLISATLLLV